jgi:hypothetical protein
MRQARSLALLVVILHSIGCQSAAEKCSKAQAAAGTAWAAYVKQLESVRAQALATQGAAHRKLIDEVDKRLAPEAQKAADGRYDRSSEAWLRAYRSSFDAVCTRDAQCRGLRRQEVESTATIADLTERLGPATAAASAARGLAAAAKRTSEAVILHLEYPQVKAAQQLTLEAYERCKDLPPPVSKPESPR